MRKLFARIFDEVRSNDIYFLPPTPQLYALSALSGLELQLRLRNIPIH